MNKNEQNINKITIDHENEKRYLVHLSWSVRVENGAMIVPYNQMLQDIERLKDCPAATLTLEPEGDEKTGPQIRAFHGPIVRQVQDWIMANEGVYKSVDRVKYELKDRFLEKQKKYWSDGSPVIIKIQHPTKKGVSTEWHMEELPSLSKLGMSHMRGFIEAIMEFYWNEYEFRIEIDPELADPKFAQSTAVNRNTYHGSK
jgi:hypothetical protein